MCAGASRTERLDDGSSARRLKGQRYPFTKTALRNRWDAARKAAGSLDLRWHDLRHTAATQTLAATGNLKVVQKQLGHKDVKTTMRYIRANLDDVREAMEKAGELRRERAQGRHTPVTPKLKLVDLE